MDSNRIKSIFNHPIKLLLTGIVLGIVIGIVITLQFKSLFQKDAPSFPTVNMSIAKPSQPEITIEYIDKKLENISELSTAELTYHGLYAVTEGKIPFITKKGFSMSYTAKVKAGIDASLIKLDITDENIVITLPPSELQMTWVDPASIQFYDEKRALFNWGEKTDVTGAIASAEEDLKGNADLDGLKETASKQAEYIIKGILEGSVGEKEILIIHETKPREE